MTSQSPYQTAPPLLLHGGRIYPSVNAPDPVEQLLLADGQIRPLADPAGAAATRIDLGGRTVLPGLIDAHLHLEHYARRLAMVDCELPSKQACLQAVAAEAPGATPHTWLLGHGWNQNDWGEYGTAAELDRVTHGRPAYLTAKSLHAAWANSAALRLAGVDAATPNPEGGAIQRDSDGRPTGILFEHAMRMVSRLLPVAEPPELADQLADAQQRLFSVGLTGLHDFDGPRCLAALQILRQRGQLKLRIIKNVPAEAMSDYVQAGLRSGFGDDWIRLGSVKAFADGALGPRTAAMLSPYLDQPQNQGILLLDREAISELGIQAAEAGFGLAVHAIGDRANHEVLEGLANLRAHERSHRLPARRHRIEHLQLLHPDDMQRPAELELVASMQPIHATSDMLAADRAWGERNQGAYAWQSQLQAGARLAFGSDAPVEDPNPFLGLHAAVTRCRLDGRPGPEGWIPEQRIALAQALAAYTEGAAYAGGMEHRQGQLHPGYLADLVVLEADPFQLPPEELGALKPVGVMVAGEWVLREF